MEAAYVHTLRFNLDTVPADWLPQGETYRSRLYEVDEDISNIMTSERNIYGGGPGQQQYLAMVECARPLDVLQPLPGATDVFNDCFWLEIASIPEPDPPPARR